MSPRRLAGWEPAQVTTIERDRWGRVVAIVTVREPEFSAADRAEMVASRRKDSAPRGSHGFLLSEASDPKNADAFRVDLPLTDFAQAALDKAQKKYEKDWPDADMDSLLWSLTLDDE